MVHPVPGHIDEVTPQWLAAVLDAPVDEIVVEPMVGAEAGFLGDVARIAITYRDDGLRSAGVEGPATVIVKLPPAAPDSRQVGAMLDVWAREQAFYREVVPASPGAAVPRCHLASGDHEQDRWVLVLEDCPSEPLRAAVGATRGQAEAVVDALAAFHARWWQAETRFEWMPGFDGRGVGGLQPVWEEAVPRFLDRYGHLVPAGTEDWLRGAPNWLPGWSDRTAAGPLTIVHADCRLDNLRYHQGRMTMIDWQTALRGPGAMDLTSFVATACTIDDRRSWEPDLIERYATALGGAGVTVDPAWLAASYDENLLWWMGQFASNLARLEPDDPEAQAGLDTMIERTFTAAADREVGRLLTG